VDSRSSYPLDCKAAASSGSRGVHQVAHYHLDYETTETASRQILKTVHMFGANDAIEIKPTNFIYTPMSPGWDAAPNFLPDGLTIADADHIAKGYRFGHVDPVGVSGLDLLFAAQVNGKNVAFAFKNGGSASWKSGVDTWIADGQSDVQTRQTTGFAPPIPFVDEDGSDLGVIVADVDGSGRVAILQGNIRGGQVSSSAYLPGATQYDVHPEYAPPFTVSQDGKIIAHYRFAKWTGGSGADLLFESGDKKGFLKNRGPGSGLGWVPLGDDWTPDITIDDSTFFVDLDCAGGPPDLLGRVQNQDGSFTWKVFRFTPDKDKKWTEESDTKWTWPFTPDTDPEAIRVMHFDGAASCAGLIVASATTGKHLALVPDPQKGWKSVDNKIPTFDLVDAKGNPSKAIVADLKGLQLRSHTRKIQADGLRPGLSCRPSQ
jgi:hypothetical protein